MKHVFTFLLILTLSLPAVSQTGGRAAVRGTVVDASNQAALSYTTIQLMQSEGESIAAGGITDDEGKFTIEAPFGTYYAILDYIGYEQFKTETFTVSREAPIFDLGTIKLSSSVNELDEVVVQAEKSTMELTLDKRIFNVGKDLGNAGGSASEILNNIPSVTVDGEGAVRLRGSTNVRILIDGKPSGLVSFKGGSGLQQLQASLVDKVEVITNPSARYEAEGMSGIINIVLKKDRKQGFNGSFELTSGHPANIGGAANLNYRQNKLNFFINYGISYRILPAIRSLYQEVYANDTTFISRQTYDGRHKGFSQNIRGGLDFFFSETSILTASYLFRRSDGNRYTDLRYDDYLFSTDRLVSYTTRVQDEDEKEPNNEWTLSYKKLFAKEGHEFNATVLFLDNWEDSDQVFTQSTFAPDGRKVSDLTQLSPNDETEKQLLFQADYVYPFGKEGKLEAGARNSFREITNDFLVSELNDNGEYIPLPGLDNDFTYHENINAIYGIYGNKINKFSYQLGLRAEWTDIETILKETGEENPRSYANLFPSTHFTFDLVNGHAVQVSYSRRIRRPEYRELNPFITFSDNRNFFSGNPDLDPEFSDVFELGHVKYFDKGSVASSVYYRQTDGIVQNIRTVDDDGFSNTRPENLKLEKAFGVEFTTGYKPAEWWKLDLNFNFFHAEIDASNFESAFNVETTTWFARQTSRFSLSPKADLQIRANYEAPRKIPQGKQKALYFFDLALTQEILKEKGRLTFNVSDIFNTRRVRTVLDGLNFFAETDSQRVRRQINLTFSYRINQD